MSKCLEFLGYKDKDGYGQMLYEGGKQRVHRVVYCAVNGVPIESIKSVVVRHACDNPSCINPEHLLTGTVQDNIDDKVLRNRQPKGTTHGLTTLTSEEVKYIRANYVKGSRTRGTPALGRLFNVDPKTIHNIISGYTWAHIH